MKEILESISLIASGIEESCIGIQNNPQDFDSEKKRIEFTDEVESDIERLQQQLKLMRQYK